MGLIVALDKPNQPFKSNYKADNIVNWDRSTIAYGIDSTILKLDET